MDLIPVRDEAPAFHANWTGWGVLGDLLLELSCDLSQMAGTNDGDVVDAPTALAWADALESAVDRIVVVRYPDASYQGGFRSELHVEGSATPVLVSSSELARAFAESVFPLPERLRETPGVSLDERPSSVPLREDPENLAWVLSFASFCRASGGFAQY